MFPSNWESMHKCPAAKYSFERTPPSFDGIDLHGGITYNINETYVDYVLEKTFNSVKIGCDYNHIRDQEMEYWHELKDIKRDARYSIDDFLAKIFQNLLNLIGQKMGITKRYVTG